MNLRKAIMLRCLDCGGLHCTSAGCPLLEMGKRGAHDNRSLAIRHYCRWCMCGQRINECAAATCSVYQYRKMVTGDLHVDFLPVTARAVGSKEG